MLSICEQFQLKAQAVSCAPYGNGHINATYLVKTAGGPDYILQRISRQAFHDVPALMRNVALVTAYLAQRDPDPRHTLHLVPALDGRSYWQAQDGEYYRVYDFITDSVSLDRPERPGDLYACAHAFGRFQQMLGSFPAQELSETIPHFHDTPARYRALREAIAADRLGRAKECEREIAFALAREEEAGTLMRMLAAGELPLRVTHNDTKLNNVILDAETMKPLCVIDLDTVMPGAAAYDFGDSIRFGANTAAEDERDLSLVSLSLPLFEAYARGFLGACGAHLTEAEKQSLPLGAWMMTMECGARFLTDYLDGDVYFSIHRPGHNLDRCRTQFALAADMERKQADMDAIIRRYS